ncbi:MAG: serine/threonine protein kinase [Micrococcales bacterium 73-13]|nr:MAG: serine/threonine protein kinase [Micrococcales bacterium 73-13]
MSENATADPMVGRLLDGRYQIRSRIARGGMATVYLATDLRLERRVAVKVMHGHLADDSAFRERFIREARSAARLAHPNVVAVFDQGEDREMAYLVMEYLPGITLRELLQEHRVLTTEQTLDIMEAVLGGLAAAHRAGIVHRDLKPENVLLADDGRIKIGDFGLARAVSANTATGAALLGTIAYLSPELVTRGVADARSDIYAVGIMMYEMLTGEQPYKGEQPVQIAYQHANSTVPAPSGRNPRVPAELDELVQWATARDPEDRPADARALLDQMLDAHGSLATALPGTGTDTGQRTQVIAGPGRRLQTGETSVLTPGQGIGRPSGDTAETTVIGGGGRQRTAPSAQVSANTAALHLRSRRRRGRGWLLLGLVLLLAIGGGGAGLWFGIGPGAQVAVPSGLQGLSPEAAGAAIVEAGLVVGATTQEPSVEVPAGLVVRTDPPEGTAVLKGSEVGLVVSTGPRSLPFPQVVGQPIDEALAALADFDAKEAPTRQFTPDVPVGAVIAVARASDGADLSAATELDEGTALTLLVSAGPLPAVAGLPLDIAKNLIEAAGLKLGSTDAREYSDEIPVDSVIRLAPSTDPVRTGDTVGVVVSQGPEPVVVPNVIGQTWAEAKPQLEALGFDLSYFAPADNNPELFRVSSLNPAAGETVAKGSKLAVTFSV